jgi:FkbM family methyltransferase
MLPDYHCNFKKYGGEYGGWNVAYEEINRNSIVYSFGIGEDISFDISLIQNFGLIIHGFDPTPKSVEFIKKKNPQNFILHEYGLANFDGNIQFFPPNNPKHVSHTILRRSTTENLSFMVPVKKLSTIMQELKHQEIDILKMDIEGAEYSIIEDLELLTVRPKQILVEFHHRFPKIGIKMTKRSIIKIKKMGYKLFSVSPSGEEFHFILASSDSSIKANL